jgi:hypothetical protein
MKTLASGPVHPPSPVKNSERLAHSVGQHARSQPGKLSRCSTLTSRPDAAIISLRRSIYIRFAEGAVPLYQFACPHPSVAVVRAPTPPRAKGFTSQTNLLGVPVRSPDFLPVDSSIPKLWEQIAWAVNPLRFQAMFPAIFGYEQGTLLAENGYCCYVGRNV